MGTKLIDTVSTAQSVIPSWYTNDAMDLLARQQAVTDRGYTPYTGARIADFTPDQLSGLEQARQAATSYNPQLERATTAANGIDFSGFGRAADSASGIGALGAAANSVGAADPYLQRAASMSALAAASPQLQQSLGYTQASTGPLGLAMAQPYLQQSGQTAADVSDYLNPYSDEVVRNLGDIGARTLREQLAPAIRDKFIASGQLQASGQSVDEARALRDVYSDTLAKQAELLQQGYTQAQAAKQTDLARFAGLAGTAGNLGFQQQGALSAAAGQVADVGKSLGQFTSADQNAQINIGQQYGALSQADTQAAISAAQAQAQAQLAAATGMTSAQQASAAQQAALAQQQQSQGLAGANALNQAGALSQTQNQKSLDQQYQDFLAQQNFPQQQIDQSLKTFQGVQGGIPQGTVGYEQQVKSGQGASLASQALGALAAAKGVGVI